MLGPGPLTSWLMRSPRLQVDTRKWAAARLAPKKYTHAKILKLLMSQFLTYMLDEVSISKDANLRINFI